jgi:uncharacterized repeat protein (TIGR02543 family)
MAVRPDNPTKDDSVFIGWYTDPELTHQFNFSEEVTDDVTLYAKWNIVISSLYATITAPVGGAHPDFTPVSGNAEAYRVEFMKWYHTEPSYTEITSEDTYVAGREYHVAIRFVANEGYQINEAADYYINGEESVTAYQIGAERGMAFVAEIPEGQTVEITSFNITGIIAPRGTESPDTTNVRITTPGVTLREARWVDEDANQVMSGTSKFVAKKKYVLVLEFDPNPRFIFAKGIGEEQISANQDYLKAEFINERPELRLYYEASDAPVVAPAVLTAPTVTISAKENAVTLNWDEQEGVTKAEVYRSENKKKWAKVGTVTTNSYTNKGLTYGKSYYYRVRLFNGTKWTGYSNIVGKKIVPSKVVNLKVASVGPTNIKVSWDKVNVNGYEVYMGTKKIATISKNSTITYNKTKLKANTTYKFKVRAYKKVGSKKVYGAWSNILITQTSPAKPIVSLSMKDFKEVNITIGKVSGVNKYIVERSLDGTTYSLLEELPNSGVLANADLETGNRYYYRVRACNGEICSSWVTSSIVSSTKTPSLTLKTSSKKVTVTVNRVNGATGYEIYRATKKTGKYTKVKTILDEEELLQYINSTSKGKTYYYKVRSYVELESMKVYSSYSSIKSIRSK